jgi:uncharacterized SAM-binding protein YcdF (DUF218 family)
VKQSPVIVIFGAAVRPDGRPSGTLRRRVAAAMAFAARWPEAIFIPTGGIGRFGASEASVMAGLLRCDARPGWSILLEETATDTLSSVRAVRRLLRAHALGGPVYAATSAYHLPRCLLLFWLAGVPARPCPPPDAPAAAHRWRRWYWRLREIPAIPYDAALTVLLRLAGRL